MSTRTSSKYCLLLLFPVLLFLMNCQGASPEKALTDRAEVNYHFIKLTDTIAVQNIKKYCTDNRLNNKESVIFLTIRDNGHSKFTYITHSKNNISNIHDKPVFYTKVNGFVTLCYFGGEDAIMHNLLSGEDLSKIANANGIKYKEGYILEHNTIRRIVSCQDTSYVTVSNGYDFVDFIPCDYIIEADSLGFTLKKIK